MARARLKRIVLLGLPRPDDGYSERADKPDTLARIGAAVEVIHRQNTPLPITPATRDTDAMEQLEDMVTISQEQWLLIASEPVEVTNWMQ